MKQMRECCGLSGPAEWGSSVCKDSARPWRDPHSSVDIWEALSFIPADSKQRSGALMVFGEDGDLNHCEPQWAALPPRPPPRPRLHGQSKLGITVKVAAERNLKSCCFSTLLSSLLIVGYILCEFTHLQSFIVYRHCVTHKSLLNSFIHILLFFY